jgi:lactate permease
VLIIAAAACFLGPSLTIAALAGPELPTLAGALVGGFAFIALLRRHRPESRSAPPPQLLSDLAPYLAIMALVLATRLIPALQDRLSAVEIGWSLYGSFGGTFQPLYHPGTILLLGLLAGAVASGRTSALGPAAAAAARRLVPVALALLALLAMSRIVVHSGMVPTLAEGAASVGSIWPLLAPAIGLLGSFVTGSATASNILFSELQLTTATALSLPPTAMMAAQGFGAAAGNMIAPHNIVAGAATVGLVGREGEVLAKTALVCGAYVAAGGALVLAYALLAG